MSIYKKILDFKSNVGAVKKDGNNPFHKSKYSTIESVLETIEKPLKDVGLGFVQCPMENGLKTIVFSDDSETTIESFVPYIGATDMQKLGSAITYARRYALVSMFGLEQEDDDGNKASGYTQKPQQKQEPKLPEEIKYITKEQLEILDDLLKASKADREKFLIAFQIKDLKFMPMKNFATAVKSLNTKIEQNKKG